MKKFSAMILIVFSIATIFGYVSGTVEFSLLGTILISIFGITTGFLFLIDDYKDAKQ